ncbi:flavodoxin domain-containing protein [Candidatus Dojkabacteria bacterium]|nr:flavodoxin domain-containing protein [Candidatus Dojkabacteria bacterium]
MKALVIYDSYFGNTEQISKKIHETISQKKNWECDIAKISSTSSSLLENTSLDLLIVGSPTRAFSPSDNTKHFLKHLRKGQLDHIKIAAFDTRADLEQVNSKILNFMVGILGYAAKPINNKLVKAGAQSIIAPEGFTVKASEGPLSNGELERAEKWTLQILEKFEY